VAVTVSVAVEASAAGVDVPANDDVLAGRPVILTVVIADPTSEKLKFAQFEKLAG
jgi:hypothetical protein